MNEVINITPTEPKLSTAGVGDTGTIKLNNLPSLDTSSASAPKKVLILVLALKCL